jgi:diguanylate cyclase (GGDEF)-like protein
MLDIDHFKAFNDRHGHQTGDEALRAVGGALCNGIRTYDCAARYGGEEFICCLPETAPPDAFAVAERLRIGIAGLRMNLAEAGSSPVTAVATVSIGIACWPETPAEEMGELVAAADRALYQAKARGRNRCELSAASFEGALLRLDTPRPLV